MILKWIKLNRFCELTGYTSDAVYAKMKKGVWLEGAFWKKGPDGHIFINTEEYQRWVEGETSLQALKSAARA